MSDNANDFYKCFPLRAETGKVQFLDNELFGIFTRLCNRIWIKQGQVKNDAILALYLRIDKGRLNEVICTFIELGIIYEHDGFLRVKFMDEQLEEIRAFREKMSESGRRGGRRKKGEVRGTFSDQGATPNYREIRKEKGERREEKEEMRDIDCAGAPVSQSPGAVDLSVLTDSERELWGKWLELWEYNHGKGRGMNAIQQEAQLVKLIQIPAEEREETIQAAIGGGWKNINRLDRKKGDGEVDPRDPSTFRRFDDE